jgi:hypothetical protein
MTQSLRVFGGLVALALSLGVVAVTRADSGGRAMDLFGTFVSFQNGVCTMKVPHGKLAGSHAVEIPVNIPVLVYTSPGHPQTHHSPEGFNGVSAGMKIEINIDSRQHVLRVCIGDTKPAKASPPTKSGSK